MKPSAGRVVHYVLSGGPENGKVRPAIIIAPCVERFPGSSYVRDECQLHVFLDGENDTQYGYFTWATSVPYDAGGSPGTWHWPPRVG